MTEWKALANAIIHDDYDPFAQVTVIGCEKCGNPFMHILVSNQFPIFVAKDSRVTITIYHCQDCGHRELDCFGTYGLPDYLPGTVLPFVGHFFQLWYAVLNFAGKFERGEDIE